jgi:hypothetical protein
MNRCAHAFLGGDERDARTLSPREIARLVHRDDLIQFRAGAARIAAAYGDSDTVSSEVLVSGVLDVRRDGAFTLRYVVRMRSLVDDTMIEDTTELSGKVSSTSAGLRLNVTANTGETLEEAWVLSAAAAAAGRTITVTFEDGNLEAVQFRRR